MIAVKIALGLVGLGIVVFMHELGHFLACRLVGIDVEAFSIGWGKPILKKKIGAVEYRLGLFPVGGYCKMKGEADFDEAWKNKKNNIPMEKGSMMAASPLRRIIVAFAGPFFNFLFAVIVLSIIWGIGFDETVLENRIVLASEFDEHGTLYPADKAGLQSGDRIIEINGRRTRNHSEVQKNIVTNPEKELQIKIDRQGEEKLLSLKPNLDKNSGAGLIGVIFWTDPVIDAIIPGSIAEAAGLVPNDRIISVNNKKVTNTVDFESNFKNIQPIAIPVEYKRGGIESHTELTLPLSAAVNPGISWKYVQYKNPSLWPHAALAKGVQESWETLSISVKSLALLFKDIDRTKAVSGPVRITYMVGEMAAGGFSQSFGTGLRSMAGILAFISIALCIMNLLPLPIIDGGLIILFIVEIIRRKPAHPKAVKIFQTAGVIIICLLMIFAFYSDIMSFMRQGSEEKLIDKIGMSVETGLVISQIAPNTYAAGTELVQNDTILKINNETVSSTADIENVINNMAKNLSTVMHIEYIRDGMENSTELTLPLNIFL